jgi:serine/threonine-protein kinase
MISDHFATIAHALSPRYRLERLLQNGIAAYVFLAEDRTTGRLVAVKVLRDEMAATVNADRFLAEIRGARQLRHPNIVPVHHSGEIEGLPYFVMPFIEGETLRARLARLGRLPLADALRITEHVARALDYAHRHRVVHRDIKPENVILDGGRAMVLDFGIALALDALEAPRYTLPGLTLGTIHYMSPEQLDGDTAVDGRADLYSLACVVYEMLCGRPPFTGRPNAVMRRHLAELPRPLGAVCYGIPPRMSTALARALEKAPDARFGTAGALVSALLGAAPPVRLRGRCVAIMPFANATRAPAIDPLSDGVSEEIAGALRDVDGLVVAPVAPALPCGEDVPVSHIRRLVRADLILLGDVRQSDDGTTLTASASLFDATDGRRIWSGNAIAAHHDDRLELGGVARNIAAALATALGMSVTAERSGWTHGDGPAVGLPPARTEPNGRSAAR